jgi:general secretion pathway protein I
MKRRAGFSLLEAIVAITLIAGTMMGLYEWINTSLISLRRVEDHTLRQEATNTALDYMETVNPMTAPSGEAEVGDYLIRWESVETAPAKKGKYWPNYQIGLYDTEVWVEWREKELARFALRRVGFEQTIKRDIPF